MVLPVPVVDHISKCIDKLLLTQTLSDENRWFCNVCNAKQDSTLFVEVKKVPNILILHLKRFINDGSNIFRDNSILACNPYSLSLKTTTDNEISLSHTPVTQVRFTYKSLQILLEETKQGGEIAISSSGMTTPLITSVNPSANIEFGWVLW